MWSLTLRDVLARDHNVHVGRGSYGPALWPGHLPRGTRIGLYCSLAADLHILRRNHPVNHLSQHPLFFNSKVGLLSADSIPAIEDNPLIIGNDVWVGRNVIITGNCRSIGDGAVVATGAVLTKDVAPFAIVGGVPAQLIRWRFPAAIQQRILRNPWWEKSLRELAANLDYFEVPVSPAILDALADAPRRGQDATAPGAGSFLDDRTEIRSVAADAGCGSLDTTPTNKATGTD